MGCLLATAIIIVGLPNQAFADCVNGAKNTTQFVVLDSNTIMLKGGFGSGIIIKTFSFINTASSITILKDDFCSYDSAVLYIDGNVVDVTQVTKVNN